MDGLHLISPPPGELFKFSALRCSSVENLNSCTSFFVAYIFGRRFIKLLKFTNHETLLNKSFIGTYSDATEIATTDEALVEFDFVELQSKCLAACTTTGIFLLWNQRTDHSWTASIRTQISLDQKVNCFASSAFSALSSGAALVGSDDGNMYVVFHDTKAVISVQKTKNPRVKPSICRWAARETSDPSLIFAYGSTRGCLSVCRFHAGSELVHGTVEELYSLQPHEKPICSLEMGIHDDRLILLSTGRDRYVKLWSLEDGSLLGATRIQVDRQAHASSNNNSEHLPWIVSVIEQGIIFGNPKGELWSWSGESDSKPVLLQTTESSCHRPRKVILNLCRVAPSLLVTHSFDRSIIFWRLTEDHQLQELVSVQTGSLGPVYLAVSTHGGTCVALGSSDGSIAIVRPNQVATAKCSCGLLNDGGQETRWEWNVSRPLGVNSAAISCLAWHPHAKQHALLAFGTGSGCVDTLDVVQAKKEGYTKTPKRAAQFALGKTIYRVAWGPELGRQGGQSPHMVVFSIGRGRIFMQRKHGDKSEDVTDAFASLLSHKDNVLFSDIAFHSTSLDFTVAIADSEGTVHLFRECAGSLQLIRSAHTGHKSVNCLAFSDTAGGPLRLAVASTLRFVSILSGCRDGEEIQAEQLRLSKHGNRIVDVDFSPHEPDLVVTASWDSTAAVWSLSKGKKIASFRLHHGKLASARFSPHEADLVYSSDQSHSVYVWRPSQHAQIDTTQDETPKLAHLDHCPILPQVEVKEAEQKQQPAPPAKVLGTSARKAKRKVATFLQLFDYEVYSQNQSCEWDLAQSPPIRLDKALHLLGCVLEEDLSRANDLDTLLLLDGPEPRAKLYATLRERLRLAGENHVDGEESNFFSLLLWLGDLGCVQRQMVALNYHSFWLYFALEVAQTYTTSLGRFRTDLVSQKAKHLLSSASENALQAATLLVCAGKSCDAVSLLREQGYLREALLLARLRLPPGGEELRAAKASILEAHADKILKSSSAKRLAPALLAALGQWAQVSRLLLEPRYYEAGQGHGLVVDWFLLRLTARQLDCLPFELFEVGRHFWLEFLRQADKLAAGGLEALYTFSSAWLRAFDRLGAPVPAVLTFGLRWTVWCTGFMCAHKLDMDEETPVTLSAEENALFHSLAGRHDGPMSAFIVTTLLNRATQDTVLPLRQVADTSSINWVEFNRQRPAQFRQLLPCDEQS